MQLGSFTTAPVCLTNLGGALYYNSTDKHFYYWQRHELACVDTPACDDCPPVNNYELHPGVGTDGDGMKFGSLDNPGRYFLCTKTGLWINSGNNGLIHWGYNQVLIPTIGLVRRWCRMINLV